MAESPDNKKIATGNLAKDLDAMLDETETANDQQDELIDDEDAIDRLLMDNAFDSPDEDDEDEFAEIDDLISDSLDDINDQTSDEIGGLFDEFAEDEDELVAADDVDTDLPQDESGFDEFDENEFSEQAEVERHEIDAELIEVPEEIDEFADDEPPVVTQKTEDSAANTRGSEFVISESEVEVTPEVETGRNDDALEAKITAIDPSQDLSENTSDSAAIFAQLNELQRSQDMFRQQLADIEAKDRGAVIIDELDKLDSENNKQQRRLAQLEQKKPTWAYAAFTVSLVALLLAGGMGVVGLGADSKIAELNESVVSLEEQLEAWVAKHNNSSELNTVTVRLDRMDMEVANYSAQIEELNRKLETFTESGQAGQLTSQLKQLSEQSIQTASVVEALQLKVGQLEKSKSSAIASKKSKVVQDNWLVNLVSFKQEWYAKRKAAEYEKQGIPVEVTSVAIKGETWYRLRVKGFKSKYDAAAYAAKVKKSLNLTSVWVTKD